MPSQPKQPKKQPGEGRRGSGSGGGESPPTLLMQGYEKMGSSGRRRLMWIGLGMMIAAGSVGLFAEALSFYRFIVVLVFAGIGSAFIFPQYGIMFLEKVLGPIIGSVRMLSRPDRRSNSEEE